MQSYRQCAHPETLTPSLAADSYGLRAPFAFTGAAALLAALYGLARLPETSTWSRSDNSGAPDCVPVSHVCACGVVCLCVPVGEVQALAACWAAAQAGAERLQLARTDA